MAGVKFYGGEIWGGGDDGTAYVYSVLKDKHGAKFVTFKSIEADKDFQISKYHFKARFPIKLKGQ